MEETAISKAQKLNCLREVETRSEVHSWTAVKKVPKGEVAKISR